MLGPSGSVKSQAPVPGVGGIMSWGPVRGISIGGVAFGVVLLVTGALIFASIQGWISLKIDLWAVCALGLMVLGVFVLVGVVYGRRMARGRWRRWLSDLAG